MPPCRDVPWRVSKPNGQNQIRETRKVHRDYPVEGRRAGVYAKECASIPTEGEDSGEADQDWV